MSVKLKVQKLDGRMSGYGYFKYRLELPYHAFRDVGVSNAHHERAAKFFEYSKILTDIYGYGPHVDDADMYAAVYSVDPAWAFRLYDYQHTYTLYFKDENVKDHIEKLLVFIQLQQT